MLDYDDLIMPKHYSNWSDMITAIEKRGRKQSYGFQNFYYLDDMLTPEEYNPDIPEYHHMMQHVYRNKVSLGKIIRISTIQRPVSLLTKLFEGQEKSIHNIQQVMALHTHVAYRCFGLDKRCSRKVVDTTVASWHHYRSSCKRAKFRKFIVKKCEEVVVIFWGILLLLHDFLETKKLTGKGYVNLEH